MDILSKAYFNMLLKFLLKKISSNNNNNSCNNLNNNNINSNNKTYLEVPKQTHQSEPTCHKMLFHSRYRSAVPHRMSNYPPYTTLLSQLLEILSL